MKIAIAPRDAERLAQVRRAHRTRPAGLSDRMRLGEHNSPTGGTLAVVEPPAPRPSVTAEDGTEYEVVWHCHRNAASLLPGDRSRPSTLSVVPYAVQLKPKDPNTKDRWAWTG